MRALVPGAISKERLAKSEKPPCKYLFRSEMSNQPMTREQRRSAKAQVVAAMNQGQSWQKAVASVGLPISRATAYRWQRRVQVEGETALQDHRHGHVYKLREPLRQWLVSCCRQAPHTPSHRLQQILREQFNVDLSIGYLNVVRAALGVRYVSPRQGIKRNRSGSV
jgi:transposase